MRSLSFGDQVVAFGNAVARLMAEKAEQQATSAALSARLHKGRLFHYDLIVGAMKPNRAYRFAELEVAAVKAGLPVRKFQSALTTAVTNRRIEKLLDRDGNRYSLPC